MKKSYTILIIIICLFAIQFYWFEIRPTRIKKGCYQDSQESKASISALDISDERYETLVDRVYEECLRKNGVWL